MNKRQEALMGEYLVQVREDYREMLRELAGFAAELGYGPVRCKTKDLTIDFRSSKVGTAIMKMEVKEQKHDGFRCGERDMPGLRLKFFASRDYSPIFSEAVRRVIEDFGGKYTGCYGCGRCKGVPEGYVYRYADGREVFRCGSELISVFDFTPEHAGEIKRLLQAQAEYFKSEHE